MTPVDTATIPLDVLLAITAYLGQQPYLEVYEMLDDVAIYAEVTEYLPENVHPITQEDMEEEEEEEEDT